MINEVSVLWSKNQVSGYCSFEWADDFVLKSYFKPLLLTIRAIYQATTLFFQKKHRKASKLLTDRNYY